MQCCGHEVEGPCHRSIDTKNWLSSLVGSAQMSNEASPWEKEQTAVEVARAVCCAPRLLFRKAVQSAHKLFCPTSRALQGLGVGPGSQCQCAKLESLWMPHDQQKGPGKTFVAIVSTVWLCRRKSQHKLLLSEALRPRQLFVTVWDTIASYGVHHI